ncbi:probable ATP-dependent RNA helicase DDX10 [Leptopilina boulardi]|uniref:probable ATP-dependent RNA helicase DDX10 n=1 Tax=Leptopilina boulardi TaxID=63433 RepID=UPI0021F63290|nr:probable ATP-dependent RNA helicase DDX10 [Leptopilina boulardi]
MTKTTNNENKKIKVYQRKKNVPEKNIIKNLQSQYETIDERQITKFADLPLSSQTQKGLKESQYITLSDIQRQSIGLALRGLNILGAAKTGSGKTLAFLIPVIETLYCKQWTRLDGIGAIIITPTRELAYQIYETLRKVGHYHDLSAGLIIGGKDLHFEKKRMNQCNIIICTPGRLLQHMDENPLFDCTTMQILVLDEADKCLDMGFETTMNAIIQNLPEDRQTLLFSATQTRSTRDLAKLSLKDPIYVSVHEYSVHTTPEFLQQSYVICELEDKIAMLWSFIKNHLKRKVIVFFSTCKQVKFMYEAFCRMRPGTSLLSLFGKMHQLKRMNIYETFCRKQNAILFATDIASRGLDFPDVDWVVQMDCPEDTNSYIHRAGRTARFQNGGESLLVLLPTETNIIDKLHSSKIPISMIKINPNKLQFPHRKLEALLARDCALKESAQRAFVAYVKSVYLMQDKNIFNVKNLKIDAFARSLGLIVAPKLRFLQKIKDSLINDTDVNMQIDKKKESEAVQLLKNINSSVDNDSSEDISDNCFSVKSNHNSGSHFKHSEDHDVVDDEDEEILTIKRRNIKIDPLIEEDEIQFKKKKSVTKAAVAKKILKKNIVPNKKINFDENGQEILDSAKSKQSDLGKEYEQEEDSGINIETAKKALHYEDSFDKKRFKEKIKEKHRKEKQKLKMQNKASEKNEESSSNYSESEEYESDRESNLSWLPDPNKIYGQKSDEDSEDESEDNSEDSTEVNQDSKKHKKMKTKFESAEDEPKIDRVQKRKLVIRKDDKNIKKTRKELPLFDTLHRDEELALQLLRD